MIVNENLNIEKKKKKRISQLELFHRIKQNLDYLRKKHVYTKGDETKLKSSFNQ